MHVRMGRCQRGGRADLRHATMFPLRGLQHHFIRQHGLDVPSTAILRGLTCPRLVVRTCRWGPDIALRLAFAAGRLASELWSPPVHHSQSSPFRDDASEHLSHAAHGPFTAQGSTVARRPWLCPPVEVTSPSASLVHWSGSSDLTILPSARSPAIEEHGSRSFVFDKIPDAHSHRGHLAVLLSRQRQASIVDDEDEM